MNNPKTLAIITILIWSFGQYFGRLISLGSAYLMLAITSFWNLSFFLLYFIVIRRQTVRQITSFLKPAYFFFGLFGFAIYQYTSNECFRAFGNGSEPTILNYTWPLFTVLFTYVFFPLRAKKTIITHIIETVGILVGFFSIIILATNGNIQSLTLNNIVGILWGVASGASYGLFSAYSSTVPKERQGAFLLASISTSFLFLLIRTIPDLHLLNTLSFTDMIITLISGVVIGGIADITWTSANRLAKVQKVSITKVASMMFFLPVFAILVIAVFLHEWQIVSQWYFVASFISIFASSYICQKSEYIASKL